MVIPFTIQQLIFNMRQYNHTFQESYPKESFTDFIQDLSNQFLQSLSFQYSSEIQIFSSTYLNDIETEENISPPISTNFHPEVTSLHPISISNSTNSSSKRTSNNIYKKPFTLLRAVCKKLGYQNLVLKEEVNKTSKKYLVRLFCHFQKQGITQQVFLKLKEQIDKQITNTKKKHTEEDLEIYQKSLQTLKIFMNKGAIKALKNFYGINNPKFKQWQAYEQAEKEIKQLMADYGLSHMN